MLAISLQGMTATDRFDDLVLRVLTGAVVLALLGCLIFLLQKLTLTATDPVVEVPVVEVDVRPPTIAVHREPETTRAAQVLLAPGHIFRCDSDGRVTFTDRACPPAARPVGR
jgi:hypothetical protein